MISGVHAIVFSPAADEIRAFFRDVLELEASTQGAAGQSSPCHPPSWPPSG